MMNHAAKIWEETVLLPTYPAAEPEKYPLFIEKRAYQGSTGKVYPLPVTEKVSDVCREVAYHAVWLENEYLRVMVLPELGGRIHRALDKTNGYDFVYYNHVVKPALVGLTGPWISGGIEFNWPQHHRPTTFSPVDYRVAMAAAAMAARPACRSANLPAPRVIPTPVRRPRPAPRASMMGMILTCSARSNCKIQRKISI